MTILLKILPALFLLTACSQVGSQVWKLQADAHLPSAFERPADHWLLPKVLNEISGLEYDTTQNALLAVNDEEGVIYQINKSTGHTDSLYNFHKKGDYEGVAIAGECIYVLKSNGKLYRYHRQKAEMKAIETILYAKNDVEGLCYEEATRSLLIAAKGEALSGKGKKEVYRYDLDSRLIDADPALIIDVEDLYVRAQRDGIEADLLWRLQRFAPSGIAVHPHTGQYFVLSARGSLLLVMGQNQVSDYLVFLDVRLLPQPEGICFSPDGDLFIASEGKGGQGRLTVYKLDNQ
ncbi:MULTISPECIES: SdiA-regulated domain-containing protein [unclassified Carboxylicivirga]|uniref:SdiA-regulated domain-containing protein n=1 Tax=Carboxylicivirga TaxID=1628153 RepID=UPI003D3298F4